MFREGMSRKGMYLKASFVKLSHIKERTKGNVAEASTGSMQRIHKRELIDVIEKTD
jgi:hypothetical protein